MSLWCGGTGTAVGWQELVFRVCAGAGHRCQGADAATQRLSFQPGAISGIGSCSPALWLPLLIPIAIIIPLGSWRHVQPLGMCLGCALCQETPNGAGASAGSTGRPHINHLTPAWDWILGIATSRGHGQGMVALEQCLRTSTAQVAAEQPTASLEAPGAGQAGTEPPSRCGSCASTTDAIHVSWGVLCGSWAAAGPQQC